MKTSLAACCAVFAAGLTVAAQSPNPQQPTQPQQPRPQTQRPQADRPMSGDHGSMMTVTGCVKPWDESMAAGRAGTTAGAKSQTAGAATSAMPRYVLTDVTHDNMGSADAAKAKQNPYGSAAASKGQTLALEVKDTTVDLSKHVNHKVQLTGSLDAKGHGSPQQSSTGTAGSTGTATTGRSTNALEMTMPKFSVTALKMVSTSCS